MNLARRRIGSQHATSIFRINHFDAKAGMESQVFAFLGNVVSVVRGSPGCIAVTLLRSADNPCQFVIIEEWDSIEAHQHAASAVPMEKIQEIVAMLDGPVKGAYYSE